MTDTQVLPQENGMRQLLEINRKYHAEYIAAGTGAHRNTLNAIQNRHTKALEAAGLGRESANAMWRKFINAENNT